MSSREEIETHMRSLDDHALLRILAIEHGDYRPEALEMARAELRRRGQDAVSTAHYLQQFPSEQIGADGFCASCRAQTKDESPGNTTTIYFIGTRLIGHDDRCPVCGAVGQTLWFCFLLPILPLGRYKVRYLDQGFYSGRYIGRRLLDGRDEVR